jgi:hypothetical protein
MHSRPCEPFPKTHFLTLLAEVFVRFGTKLLLTVISYCCFLISNLAGQTTPDLEAGLKPYGSYHGGDIDTVNLATGNLTFIFPLFLIRN